MSNIAEMAQAEVKDEEKEEDESDTNARRSRIILAYKVFKSILFIATWICMGLYSVITGPTVPDLSERLQVDYGRIGFAVAFRAIGKMVGAVPGGYIRDRYNHAGDLILGLSLFLVTLSVVSRPWATNMDLLAFLFFLEGCAHGGINCVGNAMCVLMWKEKAGLPIHFLHFGYGVGAFLAPVIARPFLSQRMTVNVTSNVSFTRLNVSDSFSSVTRLSHYLTNNKTTREEELTVTESLIEIPYAIVGIIVFSVGFMYLVLFIYKPSRKLTTMLGRTSYSRPCDAPFMKDRPKTALPILGLFFIYYMMTNGVDSAFLSFLFTYAVESGIGFSKSEAAYLNTAFYACYGCGRLIMGLVALVVPIKFILFTEVYMMTLCSAVITFYGYDKRLFIWIFSCSMAFFFGPIYPSGVAWVDRYIPLVGLVAAIFNLGDGTGAFIASWASGHLITYSGPHALLYLTFSGAVILCTIIIIAQIIAVKRGDRHMVTKERMSVELSDLN